MSSRKRVVILGSTGSIGESALKVARDLSDRMEVVGLAAGRSAQSLLKQAQEFRPRAVALYDTSEIESIRGELPSGTKIYYDQLTGNPTAGAAGFLDSNVFVYISEIQWAVGRCTVPNDNKPGLCTLSDGVGPLAGFNARIVVTYKPGGDGALYAWDGPYSFKTLQDK